MTTRAGAALVGASVVYLVLVLAAARSLGTNYEEVVPYVLSRLDIRDSSPVRADDGAPPRFVTSDYLPRLAWQPTADLILPLLNQVYMTDHLSYGGVALAGLGIDRLWAARLWHALFGAVLLWLLYDVAVQLGLGQRAALMAVAIAATSLQLTSAYALARFDESLPSFGTVTVLWAALHYARDRRARWVWIGVLAAAVAVSGKLTALWPLTGLAAAGALAGWRPPALRTLVLPVLASAPLLLPMVGLSLAGPAIGSEVSRRLAFFHDLFTSDAIPATIANLIDYLGSWGSITSRIIRGVDGRPPNRLGQALVAATLVWLLARACAPGAVPRRRRVETQMLAFFAVIVTLVMFFFREHRDYQFLLLVPVYALAVAVFLEWCAERLLDPRLPRWAAGLVVCAVPVLSNLGEQRGLHADLPGARNAMVDLTPQRASAAWFASHEVHRPIVVTFYAVGTYELLTDGVVRPIYAFPLLRASNDRRYAPDLDAVWRELLAGASVQPQFVVIPLGQNVIEARHFDEADIRAALLRVAHGEPVAIFSNRRGDPLLEVWQVTLRPAVPRAPSPPGGSAATL